ncbi:peptidoglycan D,D-transpeptidase FtsI family protein [Pandoraea anhela]|uniref:Penicillin-binding protein n=1 Tax=Pandoraea anhela TaxID=2508295 RepID=A0A5E4WQ79_9BURK|nr:penicillin-binding protein 2 [Pandoraea anhela]VVE26373.1 penicillin-binding protein [Pandoraea anhela]
MPRKLISFNTHVSHRRDLPEWRSKCVVFCITMAFLVLIARALWVQVINRQFYEAQGERRYERVVTFTPQRARILDRRGNVLAISEPVDDLWADPAHFRQATRDQIQEIAAALDLPFAAVAALAQAPNRFRYLKPTVQIPVADALLAQGIPGVHATRTERRFFPEGAATAQIVGITGRDGDGREGLELSLNRQLNGQSGQRKVIVDRLGRVIDKPTQTKRAEISPDLVLTIDRQIQRIAFDALAKGVARTGAEAGAAIVVDPRSGDILALANVPAYDPNVGASAERVPVRNRALTDAFEPGSTIKPLTVALALSRKLIRPDTVFHTSPGVIRFHGSEIRDTSNHGDLTTAQIISKSSNIGMVQISSMLDARAMYENFARFGLGQAPVKGFPGTVAGTLRPPGKWGPVEQATMSYGYGLSVSLAQLADAYAVLANKGVRVPLRLVDRGADSTTASASNAQPNLAMNPAMDPAASQRVVPESVANSVLDMLEQTVAPGGTATMARLPDYRVGAKTGTARKSVGRGYERGKYRGVFVGVAPMSAPCLVVAVMIDTPTKVSYYGGPVAGPVFAEIAEQTLHVLGVRPDK